MTLPAVLRHSKHLLGNVSWTEVEIYFELDDRLRRLITNKPGYVCRETTHQKVMEKYSAELNQPELLDFVSVWREELIKAKRRPGSGELMRHIQVTKGMLKLASSTDPLEQLHLSYMRLLTHMTAALQRGSAGNWPWKTDEELIAAEQEGEQGRKLIELCDTLPLKPEGRKNVHWLRPIIFLNWIQAVVEQQKLGYLRTPDEVADVLRSADVIGMIRATLKDNPFFWQLVYNGLELASTLRDEAAAREFHGALVKLDPGFSSFDYSPGEVVSIRREPGMSYFIETCPELDKPFED